MLQVSVIVITAAHSSVYASINVTVMYLCVGFCSLVVYAPGVTNAPLTLRIIKQ